LNTKIERRTKTMSKYILTIRPAIPPHERHQLHDTLVNIGYHVMGGGSHTDGSECDISFYDEGDENYENQKE